MPATSLFAWACVLCSDIAWQLNSLMSIEILIREKLQQAHAVSL